MSMPPREHINGHQRHLDLASTCFWIYYVADNHNSRTISLGGVGMKTATLSRVPKSLTRAAMLSLVLIAGFAIYPLTALQQTAAPTGYIAGTVKSTAGAEAGVWVIAETNDLPTKFIKIVVT